MLGFQDPDLTKVLRDSPTLSAASEAMIIQWVASHKYRLISGDIKTAFLSGDEHIRNFFISPPDDVRQMLNLDHETVVRFEKSGVWIGECAKEMVGTDSRHRLSNMDSQVVLSIHVHMFFKRVEKSIGVLGVHVDDVIGGGMKLSTES